MACGQLQSREKLEYERIEDDMTRQRARALVGRVVERPSDIHGETIIGSVVDWEGPEDDDNDRRIYFGIMWEDGEEDRVVSADLLKYLVPEEASSDSEVEWIEL